MIDCYLTSKCSLVCLVAVLGSHSNRGGEFAAAVLQVAGRYSHNNLWKKYQMLFTKEKRKKGQCDSNKKSSPDHYQTVPIQHTTFFLNKIKR